MLIGVTGPTAFQAQIYDAIETCIGANYVLLSHAKKENLAYWLEIVDGVILPGGGDIHPSFYGQDVMSGCGLSDFDMERDRREFSIVNHCLKTNKPLLGICRGHQVIAVEHGIWLIMDISGSDVCHQPKRHGISLDPSWPCHEVTLWEGHGYGPKFKAGASHYVNSFHHQAVHIDSIPDHCGIKKELVAELGGKGPLILEGMSGKKWFSVQDHPECTWRTSALSRAVFDRFKGMVSGS